LFFCERLRVINSPIRYLLRDADRFSYCKSAELRGFCEFITLNTSCQLMMAQACNFCSTTPDLNSCFVAD